ncbi:MAG: hypothetical protein F6K40_04035 [Okeania sp. SIO3I5]|uniref:phage head spike fiber domain-containing protein n=1 Tax=Okeania sp. SIO3I5 TaxID=2607805 RepID=UPI0013B7AB86|nr:hypothetical protein [Okeania sp. SIO3I5]NEQ35513.1 hypothetical protein [Okeania sp. SIO3I5]
MNQKNQKAKLHNINLDKFILIRDAELASYINEKGLISFVPANTPRFNWLSHPNFTVDSKHKFLGLLIECSSTNRLIHSTNLTDKSWIDFHQIARVAENEVLSPEGTSGNNKVISIIDLPKNDFHLIKQTVINGSRKDRTVSIFVKRVDNAGTKDFTMWGLSGLQIAVFQRKDWQFISGKATKTTVDLYPNGWVRLSATYNASNDDIYFGTSDGSNSIYMGENQKQFYLYGPQLEDLSEVTSYIPTDETQKLRGTDIAYIQDIYYQGNHQKKRQYIDINNIEFEKFEQFNKQQISYWRNDISETLTLVENLVNKGEYEKAVIYYGLSLYLNSEQFITCSQLLTRFAREELVIKIIEYLENLLLGEQNKIKLFHDFSVALAKQNLMNEAIICWQKSPQNVPSVKKITEKIWQELNQQASYNICDDLYKIKLNPEEVREYLKITNKYTVIDLNNLTNRDIEIIEAAELSLANVEFMRRDGIAIENLYINGYSCDSGLRLSEKIKKNTNYSWHLLNETRDFQQSIIETGYVYTLCPVTGKIIKSNQSFYFLYINDRGIPLCFYRFVGSEVFYLIVGGWDGGKIGIYLPRLDLVIHWSITWGKKIDYKLLIDEFKTKSVINGSVVKNYISTKEPKIITAIIGCYFNLGHYFWNELGGLQYLYESGILEKVDKFLIAPHNRLDITEIFPEIPKEKITSVSDFQSTFSTILHNNYFVVRPTESCIRKGLSSRVYQASMKKCSQSFLEKVEQSQKYFPLLWINLRQHNKCWKNQIQGNANIITNLSQEYPNMAVIFDGMVDTKELMEKITALIPSNVKTYDATTCTMNETIYWAYSVDTYIAVVGSGLTFLSWLANKPGIAHGNHAHLSQGVFWGEVREEGIPPIFIDKKYVFDQRNVPGIYQNYDCDWKIIYDELIKIIKDLELGTHYQNNFFVNKKYQIELNNWQLRLQEIKKKLK